jgi:hypothetical protein
MDETSSSRLDPNATFDCVFLATRLQRVSGSFAAAELHLFAYLACLLWLYSGRTTTDWGYAFVGTELGAPFSLEMDAALEGLEGRGLFTRSEERIRASDVAEQYLRDFMDLELNRDRGECLHAAWSSTAALSIGMVGNALSEEPELKRARALPSTRFLLEEMAVAVLHEQFDVLKLALNDGGIDLRVPAVVWLEALYHTGDASSE